MRRGAMMHWQTEALRTIDNAWRRGRRAALLQLPTGLGKTRVAAHAYRRLLKRSPGLRLIVSVRSATLKPETWLSELRLADNPKVPENVVGRVLSRDGTPTKDGTILFTTHRRLLNAMTARAAGKTIVGRWLRRDKVLVIIDEVHRSGGIRKQLADAYWGSPPGRLPAVLREKPGRKSLRVRWLLLSATPYNPVSLDYSLDLQEHDTAADRDEHLREVEIIADEVGVTLGLLAKLDRQEGERDRLKTYVSELKAALRHAKPMHRHPPLIVVPHTTDHLRPRRPPPSHIPSICGDLGAATSQLLHLHKGLLKLPHSMETHETTVERLVLGGARRRGRSLFGHGYGKTTLRAVYDARLSPFSAARTAKFVALDGLLRHIFETSPSKVVIFCVHRAVATAVTRHVRKSMQLKIHDVFDASHADRDRLRRSVDTFQNVQIGLPRILVTTDRLSESIDLHNHCRFLIHFELPWSPLRVLQRVGRLWRIRLGDGGVPRAPWVFHVCHPGSAEEEILARLYRRWRYVETLGLDYLSSEMALGTRVPAVPWHA